MFNIKDSSACHSEPLDEESQIIPPQNDILINFNKTGKIKICAINFS